MGDAIDLNCPKIIPSTGLTVLVSPEKPSLDVIFVHGFTGHPQRTWTQQKPGIGNADNPSESSEPPPKRQKFSLFSDQRQRDHHTSVFWPRDLLPTTLPDARVLTYGYDSHLRHKFQQCPVNKSTVYDIAGDFLVALEAERREEPLRPTIFVVHSLGGIIVKEMLRRSSLCQRGRAHLHNIFDSTQGILFFGTPHGGADPRGILQRVAEKVIKAAGVSVNEQLVNTLLPSAERLRELRDEFGPMAEEQNWHVHSFQEQYGVALLSGNKVVEDTSSYLNLPAIEVSEHIGRNHMDMCRFSGLNDVEYRKVASALRRIADCVSGELTKRKKPRLDEAQRKILLESLAFDQLDTQQLTIKNAHTKTCAWLLKTPEYVDWLDATKLHEHHGFLWIKGKPGTGKSTLMKFALGKARRLTRDKVIISFFFNARGEDLEKSTCGAYRSLLLQLLEQLPELQCVFDDLGFSSSRIRPSYHTWSIESLKEMLQQAILQLRRSSVVCFVDALDECDEDQVIDMLSFFEQVGDFAVPAGIKFQTCFSSRHYPHITIERSLNLVLEGQEGHEQDITDFLDSELKIGHSTAAEQIRSELREKAAGTFIWVVLVVDILNRTHARGHTHTLRRKLQEIPANLHELFRDILTRDSRNKDELVLSIQWILFAKQPLTPAELYFAVLSGTEPDVSGWSSADITPDTFERFILDSSKGLAEFTISKSTTRVQFIHESVRDFFLKENGLGSIWPDLKDNFQGQSHERLRQCCLAYLDVDFMGHPELGDNTPEALHSVAESRSATATRLFPFLEYAVHNVLYHADMAAGHGIPEEIFLKIFDLPRWIRLDNLLETRKARRHTEKASLLYILAERNMANLLKTRSCVMSCLVEENERYRTPLFAALATGSKEAVLTFREAHVVNTEFANQIRKHFNRYDSDSKTVDNIGRGFKFSKKEPILNYLIQFGEEKILLWLFQAGEIRSGAGVLMDTGSTLCWAIRKEYEPIVHLLIEQAKIDVNSTDETDSSPLSLAIRKGDETLVQLLLEREGIDVSRLNIDHPTLLISAVKRKQEAITRHLLQHRDINVNLHDDAGLTPLTWAARLGHENITRLLLERDDVIVDSIADSYLTPLHWAATEGHEAVVMLLIERVDLKINTRDLWGLTPLSRAVRKGHKNITMLLLKRGDIDVNIKDKDGWTPLTWAAKGHSEAAQLLLQRGDINVNMQDIYGRTPLTWAAKEGHSEVAQLLLKRGDINVNIQDNNGWTPLTWVAKKGHSEAAQLLLERGDINVNVQDNNGWTPLQWALSRGHESVVMLLLERDDVDVSTLDWHRCTTLLSSCAREGYEVAVRNLLQRDDIEVNGTDWLGTTPLSYAVQGGHQGIAKLLLEHDNVNAEEPDRQGRTPLSWAARRGNDTLAKLLLEHHGVNPSSKDRFDRTPLHWAAFRGHEATVKVLLEHKDVNSNAEDFDCRTPLYLAVSRGHEATVRILLERKDVRADVEDKFGYTPLLYAVSKGYQGTAKLLKSHLNIPQ